MKCSIYIFKENSVFGMHISFLTPNYPKIQNKVTIFKNYLLNLCPEFKFEISFFFFFINTVIELN